MSIFKDLKEDTDGYRFKTKLANMVSPSQWRRLHTWRKQRANRGWSDRDTWGAGEHIAKITAEMLQHLNDKSHVDWPEWFKLNVQEKGKDTYKSLQQVIDDINAYLVFSVTTWGDDLTCEGNMFEDDKGGEFKHLNTTWRYEKNGRKLSEQQISARIKSWSKEYERLYNKAVKAMSFFARHFASFWD